MKSIKIISSIILLIVFGLTAFFGGKTIYDSGITNGRQMESDEISEKLNALGNAISEKESFQKAINNLFSDLPAEINNDGIKNYIEKLTGLIDETSTEKVKELLNSYLEEWKNFGEVYSSESNPEITENFNQLKTKAEDLSAQIKTTFDKSIEESLEEL